MQEFSGYISYAPFPEGFSGDLDETFQQSGQLAIIYISGNFLTGLYYQSGTVPPSLPTSDVGPIAMNGIWYFWDPVSGQYLPQSSSVKVARNLCKNPLYQLQQTGPSFNITAAGTTALYDMCQVRASQPNNLTVASDTGPVSNPDTDQCAGAIKYTVGPSGLVTLSATDLFAHEHLVEGIDLLPTQGQLLSLSFDVWVTQAGYYSAYLANSGRDMSYVFTFNVATANQWTRVKINSIPALPTGSGTWNFTEGHTGLYLGVVMATGTQWQTTTTNKWLNGFFAGTSQNNNMISGVNNQIKVSAIKLETSPNATYFTARTFEEDYEDCIRYYWTSFNYQSTTAGVPLTIGSHLANAWYANFMFPKRMCRPPTVNAYGVYNKAINTLGNISTGADVALSGVLGSVQKGVISNGTVTAGIAKGDELAAFIIADARLS